LRKEGVGVLDFGIILDDLFDNPRILIKATPYEWYKWLLRMGYKPEPLGQGNLSGVPFEQGGGFILRWGGDKMLQYHPSERSHHDGAYWKLSSGNKGIVWYDMQAAEIRRKGGNSG